MRTNLLWIGLCLCLPVMVQAAETVVEFKGSSSKVTAEFEVEAPWLVEWRVTTDGQVNAAVEVNLEAAGTGVYEGRVLTAKYPGNGARLFDLSGRYYFRVNSSLVNWTLTVIKLSPEEAKLYTPRSKALLDQN